MAIDIRAITTCNLGPLISASISDDYIQGSGLIKTSGRCEISGLITPALGSVVTFSYTKQNITRTIPRKMRVLSSFADPFRRTTQIELGCRLTYLQDLQEPLKWTPFDDPDNEDLTEQDEIVTLPIRASSIANECLRRLGVGGFVYLSNKFSVAEFDFSSGYVQTLSDLLVSESKCGYLDYNESLVVFSLSGGPDSGVVLRNSDLLDIGAIGIGDLPADAVYVKYNSLRLKAPDDVDVVCRQQEEQPGDDDDTESQWGSDLATTSSNASALFAYKVRGDDSLRTRTYRWTDFSKEQTFYRVYSVYEDGSIELEQNITNLENPAVDKPVVEKRNLVSRRVIYYETGSAGVAGGNATEFLAAGQGYGNTTVFRRTEETFDYDTYGNETRREATTYGSSVFLAGSAGINTVYERSDGGVDIVDLNGFGTRYLEKVEVLSAYSGNKVKRVTKRYGPWLETISGQQAIARAREYVTTAEEASDVIRGLISGLYLIDVTVNVDIQGSRDRGIPSNDEVAAEELTEEEADPNNGFSTASESLIELVTGSPLATRRIELNMPYAPDDSFQRNLISIDPVVYCYASTKSDAEQKARLYGITQNRLLFGNRNGMSIQTTPELIPSAPFSAFYVNANGVLTQYRTNATSWTIDNSGIVASTDALYWGVAGKLQ